MVITHHAVVRYQERVEPKVTRRMSYTQIMNLIESEFSKAVENKAIRNNTSFMMYLFDRYGTTDVKFYETDKAVFIVSSAKGDPAIVTCYHTNTISVNHLRKKKNYRKVDE